MNPSGKSYIAILHEYLQQSLKIQPVYEFKVNGLFELQLILKKLHARNYIVGSHFQKTYMKPLLN